MTTTGKVWGRTRLLLQTPMIEVHWLDVLPNMRCSLHKHAHKWNSFIVVSGSVSIEVHKADYDLIDVTVLGPGEVTSVKPGENHRFLTGLSPAVMLEVYHSAPLAEDILRTDCGGSVLDS